MVTAPAATKAGRSTSLSAAIACAKRRKQLREAHT